MIYLLFYIYIDLLQVQSPSKPKSISFSVMSQATNENLIRDLKLNISGIDIDSNLISQELLKLYVCIYIYIYIIIFSLFFKFNFIKKFSCLKLNYNIFVVFVKETRVSNSAIQQNLIGSMTKSNRRQKL